jgi:hypothetical protein
MRKNKKLLLGFFAVNSIINAGTDLYTIKNEKMFNKIIENIESGKSNNENYKLIDKILNKKNAELKDLYLQNDYVIKPEYLEWQWFVTGFYAERSRGDNTSKNAQYRSKTEGYYNSEGEYVVTEGKPFHPEQTVKSVNLGMSIPLKGLNLGDISINPGEVSLPDINDVTVNVTVPSAPVAGNIDLPTFTPTTPSISIPSVFVPPALDKVSTGFAQGASVGFIPQENVILGNSSASPVSGTTTVTSIGTSQFSITGSAFTWDGYNDSTSSSGIANTGTYSMILNSYPYTFLNVLAGSSTLNGNWVYRNQTTGTTPNTARFVSVNHAYGARHLNTEFHLAGNASIYGRNDGHMTVGIEYQAYDALSAKAIIDSGATLTLESGKNLFGMTLMIESPYYKDNYNKIPIGSTCASGICRPMENLPIYSTAENRGKIVINSQESIGIDFAKYSVPSSDGSNPMAIYVKPGNIEVNGSSNYGIRVPNIFDYGNLGSSYSKTSELGTITYSSNGKEQNYFKETIIDGSGGMVTVGGTQNVGISLSKKITGSTQVAAVQGITASDSSDLIVNIRNLNITVNGTEGIGILRNANYVEKDDSTNLPFGDIVLKNINVESLNFGTEADKSVLIRSDRSKIILEKDLALTSLLSAGKKDNIVMLANNSASANAGEPLYTAKAENKAKINIGAGLYKTTGLLSANGGEINNSGTGEITVNSQESQAMAVLSNSTGFNSGKIAVTGLKSVGIANMGEFTMTAGEIDAAGDQSVAVYGADNNNKTNLYGGTIKVSNNGIGLFAGDNATINITGASLEANDKGLLIYTYKDTSATASTGHINITGTVNANINAGGTAFYLKDDLSQITNFINSVFTGSGKLNLNMTSSDSRLFILDSPVNDIYLSSSSSSAIESLIPSSKVSVTGTGYKPYSVFKGSLIVDQNVNLDDINDAYNRLDFLSSKTVVNSDITISGTGNNISAIGQRNYTGTSGRDELTVINNGTIKQTGQKVIGIVTDFGNITNNGTLSSLGDDSIGVYGANGTISKNTGKIEIGNNSIGIYGGNLLTALAPGYGNQKIEIENYKDIKASGLTGGIGIYADNNTVPVVDSTVKLSSTSNIDMSSSVNGVGIYAKNSTVTGEGMISAGKNGIGINLENSTAVLNNITVNLSSDNSVGINLAGTSSITGTGIFTANGKNVVLLNMQHSAPNSAYINYTGFTVNGTGNYIAGNIENAGFYYNGTDTVSENSTMAIGKNSVILFDHGTNISTSGNNNIIGMADGAYSGAKPFNFTGLGVTADRELTNKGNITTGDKSVALYAKNNAGILNAGNINTGKGSAGLYGVTVNNVENNGIINIGENSKGIYLKDGILTSSLNTGKILSSSDKAVGIISDYNGASPTLIETINEIKLTGENSIGIYTTGSAAQNISNKGLIEIGNSSDRKNPSIGIYNTGTGNSILNTGIINTGENSLGIYSKGGNITEDGNIIIGSSGVGIYSDGGNVIINNTGSMNVGTNLAVGIYALNNAVVKNDLKNIKIGNGSYGIIAESGSDFTNTAVQNLNDNSVFVYGKGAGNIINALGANINVTGSENIIIYTVDGGTVLNYGNITANAGKSNIGIYNNKGSITNHGDIFVGDTVFAYDISGNIDPGKSKYAVGIYGEMSKTENYGNINIGNNAVGLYVKNNSTKALNYGNISAGNAVNHKDGAIGILLDGGAGVENHGNIDLYGKDVIGIAGKGSKLITNLATITVAGENAVGIYSALNTVVDNQRTINVSGKDSVGIIAPSGKIINTGVINFTNGAKMTAADNEYKIPELINAGIIKVNGNFENTGMNISLKPDLSTLQKSTIAGIDFIMNSGSISADTLTITDTVKILPDFSQGTNAKVYKLENAFISNNIISPTRKLPLVSSSLTWEATPSVNSNGNIDIYMSKIDYHNFTDGLWYDDFGKALDENYNNAAGNAGKIYDKLDLIEKEKDFRHVMESLAGNIYANINQREEDIARTFENSMDIMQNSENNTKENIKLNIIGGKGRTKEDTDGITDYDYTTTGIQALREVERTYKNSFGYSMGYLHTGFEFKDNNSSKERVDTVQAGIHNKYTSNGWKLRNDLTGRVSFHNVDRNVEWPSPSERSEMNGSYETYSVTSDNIFGKELSLGKKTSITPYGGLRAMYVTRPDFSEKGTESLKVEGNDAWSVKPRVGVELKTAVPLSKSGWELKGNLDIAYEYELADLNERENAKLTAVENDYHKLSKPQDEKGTLKTRASVGVEVSDRYGIFLTGEYKKGNDDQEDYRAGVLLKAVF